jgi:precorrin-6B methylase 2
VGIPPKNGGRSLAHIGKYSLQIAKIVGDQGKVIAIEPDPEKVRNMKYLKAAI